MVRDRMVEVYCRSSGAASFSKVGSTPQISRAYWEMVRSLENLPEPAMLRIAFLVHSLGFCSGRKNRESAGLKTFSSVKTVYNTHLIQSTDFLLAFDVVLIVGENLEPAQGETKQTSCIINCIRFYEFLGHCV